MSLISDLKLAYKKNSSFKGKIIVLSYVVMRFFRKRANNKLTLFLCAPIIIVYKFITDFVLGCEIPASTNIGKGLIIHHGRSTVLNKYVILGNNVTLKHNTTIGNKEDVYGNDLGSPVIEDNVIIGPHSIILGPITIGKNAIIGAGSVVVKSVEPYTVVAGNPAKLIRKIESNLM